MDINLFNSVVAKCMHNDDGSIDRETAVNGIIEAIEQEKHELERLEKIIRQNSEKMNVANSLAVSLGVTKWTDELVNVIDQLKDELGLRSDRFYGLDW